MKKLFAIGFTLLFFPVLSGQNGTLSKLIVLKLAEPFSKQAEVPLSRLVDKISFIPLETNAAALITEGAKFEVTNDYIIVRQSGAQRQSQILLFNLKTGKFIREIGKQGRGPGEFSIYSPVPYNPGKKEVYGISFARELLAYDLTGKNTGKIRIPELSNTKFQRSPDTKSNIDPQRVLFTADNMLDDSIFAGYVINFSGLEPRKMVLFSQAGVLKVFPNNLTYSQEDRNSLGLPPPGGFAKFYKWDNKLYFIEAFCDTLYRVTKNSLVPRYFFDWGKFNAPYVKQAEIMATIHLYDFFYILDLSESNSFIFLRVKCEGTNYVVFIEKKTNSITFCKKLNSGNSAFIDDLSGLTEVVPLVLTQKNEMVYMIQAPDLLKWFEANPEKATTARNRFPWLKDIDELSNPIIVIGKCKD